MKKLTLFYLIVFSLSCSNNTETSPKTISQNNENAYKELMNKYQAISYDSINGYTYVFQKLFLNDKKLLMIEGKVSDFKKEDSSNNYILQVYKSNDKDYAIFQIILDSSQFTYLQNKFDSNKPPYGETQSGYFVMNVSKITTKSPSIDFITDRNQDDELIISFDELHNQRLLFFTGKLVDFYKEQVYTNN